MLFKWYFEIPQGILLFLLSVKQKCYSFCSSYFISINSTKFGFVGIIMNKMDHFNFESYCIAHKIYEKMNQKLSFIGFCDSCHFNFFLKKYGVSCCTSWCQIHYVAKDNLEILIILPLPPRWCADRLTAQCPANHAHSFKQVERHGKKQGSMALFHISMNLG